MAEVRASAESGDGVPERSDAIDRDGYDVAVCECEIVFGNNACTGHQAGTGGKGVIAKEIADKIREFTLDLRNRG